MSNLSVLENSGTCMAATGIYVSEELKFWIHMYIYLFNEFIHRKGHVQHSEGSIIFYDYVF